MSKVTVSITNQHWDVAVIGGGPAGMMAAGRAAELGARVILIEKNKVLGRKLSITGGGRCNVTNAELDTRKFLAKFKDSGKFLSSPFAQWGVQSSLDFFHDRGMLTKIEAEQRVFPVSNSALSVVETLTSYLQESGVHVLTRSPVKKIQFTHNKVTGVEISGGTAIQASSFILATGGTSHPETGSTGDGYIWLKELRHTVHESRASLVPIAIKDSTTRRAAGASVKNAKVTVFQNEIKQSQIVGKILYTHVGFSGPAILNSSREVGELLKYGPVSIEIDLIPELGYEKINLQLQTIFKEMHTRKIKNALAGVIAPVLIPLVLAHALIDPETLCNSVTREARMRLIKALKHSRYEVQNLLGLDKAIITAGGIALTEVDFKSMRSNKYENLFLVGDILDIDRPSGGYSLQLCWTSGYVAGSAAAHYAKK